MSCQRRCRRRLFTWCFSPTTIIKCSVGYKHVIIRSLSFPGRSFCKQQNDGKKTSNWCSIQKIIYNSKVKNVDFEAMVITTVVPIFFWKCIYLVPRLRLSWPGQRGLRMPDHGMMVFCSFTTLSSGIL